VANVSEKLKEAIIIDEPKGLVFRNETELYNHFVNEIEHLEGQYFSWRQPGDIPEEEFFRFEPQLNALLEEPDEVWEDTETIPGMTLSIYLKDFSPSETEPLFHVAVVYATNEIPTFVYLHFPTKDLDLVERYQRGELVFDLALKKAPLGAIVGDALLEGDPLALGLYQAMLTLRSDEDIEEKDFREYGQYREECIEDADEIWRSNDSQGNVLVSFIKDCSDQAGQDLFYVVVTLEDTPSNSHALLFSFPTRDGNLLSRYRHGENLQAEEVVQESSH
jgi:hypothetical protein